MDKKDDDKQRSFPSRIRLTDLPRPKWWGGIIRLSKTIEVLIFKCLQIFDIYRPQKTVVGIPTLATANLTSLQAVVYNGTPEEMIGFKPRRLLHRILKGIPDLELYERVRFQVNLSDNTTRTVQGSTETRGFIHLQLPWVLSHPVPVLSWAKMLPMGVETLTGLVQLGEYQVVSAPVFFLSSNIKWIIISDIDDTIKDSKIKETTSVKQILKSILHGHYYTYQAIEGMAELYQELRKQGCLIVYLTSTPYPLAPFLLKFLREAGFPDGPVFMRWLGYGQYGHKWRTLKRVMSNLENQKCILIGDSGEQDLQIYRRVIETRDFSSKVEKIFIRHVPGTPLLETTGNREVIYRQIEDLKAQILNTLIEG